MFDYLITGGTIVDGTGAKSFQGDIAISDDRIVAIGTLDGEAKEVIDATGLVVSPGFVDPPYPLRCSAVLGSKRNTIKPARCNECSYGKLWLHPRSRQ